MAVFCSWITQQWWFVVPVALLSVPVVWGSPLWIAFLVVKANERRQDRLLPK